MRHSEEELRKIETKRKPQFFSLREGFTMKLRELGPAIEEEQTAMLYSDKYRNNCHVYKEGDHYVWADVNMHSLCVQKSRMSWQGILGHLPEAESSEWDVR